MNDIYNRKDEEFTVIGEVPESLKLNDPLYKEGFQAGAASRDAEVAELKSVPMKYRRMAFNAQLQDEVAKLEKENNQLRAQINALTSALNKIAERTSSDDPCRPLVQLARDSLASTPEQSLAEYRNKAIEECAKRAEAYAYMSQNFNALAEELRAMKEQP